MVCNVTEQGTKASLLLSGHISWCKHWILRRRQNLIAAISGLLAGKSIVTPLLSSLIRSLLDRHCDRCICQTILARVTQICQVQRGSSSVFDFSSYVSLCGDQVVVTNYCAVEYGYTFNLPLLVWVRSTSCERTLQVKRSCAAFKLRPAVRFDTSFQSKAGH